MNNPAYIVATISDDGRVIDISVYSSGPNGLTRTGRNCHYAQLGPKFEAGSFGEAMDLARNYYNLCHAELAKKFPLR